MMNENKSSVKGLVDAPPLLPVFLSKENPSQGPIYLQKQT